MVQSSSISSILLSNNRIGDAGAEAVSVVVEENKALREVHIQHNQIGGKGMRKLAMSMLGGHSLTHVRLEGNEGVDEEEVKRLLMRVALGSKALVELSLGALSMGSSQLGLLRLLYDCNYLPEDVYKEATSASS
jgi:Ran GTPase-activating protein (RanGAP) involved in mRNA processing and transport